MLLACIQLLGERGIRIHKRYLVRIQNPETKKILQPDQLNMTVFFWYLVRGDLAVVRYCTPIHVRVDWTNNFLQGIRNTRPCITGHPVVLL